jgi:hypothetical protein
MTKAREASIRLILYTLFQVVKSKIKLGGFAAKRTSSFPFFFYFFVILSSWGNLESYCYKTSGRVQTLGSVVWAGSASRTDVP